MELKHLFSPGKIGKVEIKNRIVRSATYEGIANKGYVSDELINLYTELARGGTGLIITGALAVDETAAASPTQPFIYSDDYIEGQKRLVKAVHDASDVKIAAQIVHPGRQGFHPKYPNVAPSPVKEPLLNKVPKELTGDEIRIIIKKFVDASRRVYECDYDMVQLHGGHGYLLSNFISPYTNLRSDDYGGDIRKRTRILIDIYNLIRDEVGKKFPITVKLQTQDEVPGGLTLDEAVEVAKIVINAGYDAIEPTGGIAESRKTTKNPLPGKFIKTPDDENYLLPTAKTLKPIMKNCSLMLMGGIKRPESAEKFLREKTADFISMCRPLIYEPNLPNRWRNGDHTPAYCISCNGCGANVFRGPLYCVTKKKLETEKIK